MRYSERELTGILVGDAGYPCLPFLMTPIANPVTDEQITYNNIQSGTRIIVERAYGVWKRRFPCLSRGLTNKLICSTTIVVACAVLHNLSLIFNDKLPDDDLQDDHHEEPNEEIPAPLPNLQPADGFAFREAIIERMFNG
ncbi:GSCOCG00012256001-RA-CDS [Cotesia congregata]|uniref:Similar to harbi1: Putative nuclease HARBI1 (Danio rerio) n=1 Tax=Cotesia congregata TaxID=51543 RepID=A0A8J2EIB1_COTCN|nr:GSCOCG00012256001-RA-CDS [Cotesia congregata]CAG5073442.1 Similar to harbi1: Putative nuclease HARBI1 (Danio rerio) [Cotesia congregata]